MRSEKSPRPISTSEVTGPAISIITPTFNGQSLLGDCIDSVLGQTFTNWEWLISDDRSTDESRSILRELAERGDERIRITFQKQNLGIFENLNFLFSKAKAPLAQILCQDDRFWAPTSLSTLAEEWKHAPSSVGFQCFNRDPSHPLTAFLQEENTAIIQPKLATALFLVFGNFPGNLSNVSLRTEVVHELSGFNQTFPYAGDFDFWSRLSAHHCCCYSTKQIVSVQRHPDAASFHLNRKGELLDQLNQIYAHLYSDAQQLFPSINFRIILTNTIAAQHIGNGLRLLLRAKGTDYLRKALTAFKPPAFLPLPFQIASTLITFGGHLAASNSKKRILMRLSRYAISS